MEAKRYSVFISSTFEDLRDERRAVQDTVIEAGDFPVQMESFPASDEDALDLIKSLLDKCDYYVLIIGGRYGSLLGDGMSFTHKEFRYAVEQGIPVLVMLHGNRGAISAEKTEASDDGRERLEAFILEASTGRTRKTWTSTGDLKAAVLSALVNSKQVRPRVGWVRGDAVASVEALEQLNAVRIENAKFREAMGHVEVEISLPPLPPIDSEVMVDLQPRTISTRFSTRRGSHGTIKTTWMGLFPVFFSNLSWGANGGFEGGYWTNRDESRLRIGSAVAQELTQRDTSECFALSTATFERLLAYYREVGLMHSTEAESPFTELAEKVARRHRIAGGGTKTFSIVEGDIEVTLTHTTPTSDEPPVDDIPF